MYSNFLCAPVSIYPNTLAHRALGQYQSSQLIWWVAHCSILQASDFAFLHWSFSKQTSFANSYYNLTLVFIFFVLTEMDPVTKFKEDVYPKIIENYNYCIVDDAKSKHETIVLRLPLVNNDEAGAFKTNLSSIMCMGMDRVLQ